MRFSQENEVSYRQKSCQSPSPQQEKTPNSLTFPSSSRLLKRSDFSQVQRTAKRFAGQFLQMDYRLGHFPRVRLGITVSKRYGKAHERNRFKRLVREAFRLRQHFLPPSIDINVLPKKGRIPLHLEDCAQDFEKLVHELSK